MWLYEQRELNQLSHGYKKVSKSPGSCLILNYKVILNEEDTI